MAELYALLQVEHDQAWDLVNALTGGAGDDPLGSRQRKRLAQGLVSLLSGHELTEELVVWPAVRRRCPDGAELAAAALEQEDNLKLALNELSSISPSEEFDECTHTVAAQMRTHLSYEQSQVWPRLRDSVSDSELTALAENWRGARAAAATRPHPHLPADPKLLGAVMPLLAAADRWAELLHGRVALPGV